ncbi:Spermidine/putrescine import ATP-binding protein PotA [compost metagenome]
MALARAIVNRPKLLLLDEPLSALDMKLRKRMQLELKHLQAKLGIAFIFVTHDQEEAMTIADRIVVMNAGRIEQAGSSSAIYSTPASRFVADFIGEANLIDYRATGKGEVRLTIRDQPLFCGDRDIPPQGVAVLRPEHLQVLDAASAESASCNLSGTVTDVVTVGSHTLIHTLVNGQSIVARTMGFPRADLAVGGAVRLAFDPAHLHLVGEPA